MSPDFFLTISGTAESELKEKGSRFISFAFAVDNEPAIRALLNDIRQKFPDASHHCYAYVLGAQKTIQHSSDDGEPSNSAGKPILRQILSKGVSNTLVVVVRYFGGTQLGVPGLIAAYGQAAREVLNLTETVEQPIEEKIVIEYDYADEGLVYRLIKKLDGRIISVSKQSKGNVEFNIRVSKVPELSQLAGQYYQLNIRYLH